MVKLKVLIIAAVSVVFAGACSRTEKQIVSKYDNSQPSVVYYLKTVNGKKTKVRQENFYPNGKKRMEGNFSQDKPTGVWKYYFEDGSEFARADFSSRKEGSQWQIHFDKDSLLVNKNDSLIAIAFSSEGTPVSIRIKRNQEEVFFRFFNSFKIMQRVNLKGNIPNGESMSWFENGNINSWHYYKQGFQDSTYTVFAENGQKIISGHYTNGKKTGKWEYFSSSGQPLGTEVYDVDGTLLIPLQNNDLKYFRSESK